MAITRIKNNQITDLTVNAASKLQDFSITAGKIANNLTYGSDLTVAGNLTISGVTTTIDTTNLSVEDALLLFASGQTGSPTLDIGFIGDRGDDTNVAFVFDESEDKFVAAFTTSSDTGTTITVTDFADLQLNDLEAANVLVTGDIDISGDMTLSGNVAELNVTGTISAGNIQTTGTTETGSLTANTTISATGNVSGGNLTTAGVVDATGNVSGGNLNTSGTTQTGDLSANTSISAGTTISATGNVSGGNLTTAGEVDATGNVSGGNLNTSGTTQTGDLSANTSISAGTTVTATGNISGGNLNTSGTTQTGSLSANTTITATGNVSGGNLTTAGVVDATGNVSGGNLNTSGTTQTGDLSANTSISAGTTISATGNVSGGNITTSGEVDATGNITGDSINADTSVVAPNVEVTSATVNEVFFTDTNSQLRTDANLTFDTSNLTLTGSLTVDNIIVDNNTITSPSNVDVVIDSSGSGVFYIDRSTTISGNLSVLGTTTTINSEEKSIVDPIISIGRGPNFTPLTSGDGKDRGIAMFYFDTEERVAFMGYDDPSGEWRFFDDATITDEEVTGTLGDVNVGGITSTFLDSSGNVSGGNLTTGGEVNATGNVSGGNLTTAGTTQTGSLSANTTISATGNVSGGNLTIAGTTQTGSLSANTTISATGNISGGNITTSGEVDATGNVSGGNLTTGGEVNATGNVSGGNITTGGVVDATGNVSGGNITTSGTTQTGSLSANTTITATGNVSGGNITTSGEVDATGNISGGNITTGGEVDATGNISGGNLVTSGELDAEIVVANTSVTTPLVTSTSDIDITSGTNGNISLTPDGVGEIVLPNLDGDRLLFTTANSEVSTDANASFNGEDLSIFGSLTVDNVTVDDNEIRSLGAELIINRTNGDVDLIVSGSTVDNLFVVDAGTDSVAIGSANVISEAILTLDSTDSMILPSGTTGERPVSPVDGMFRFNTTDGDVEYYDGEEWIAAGTIFTVIESQTFSGDGSTAVFTLTDDATTASAIVSINGVVQLPTTAYAISGTTLTFTEAPESGDDIEVRVLTTTTTVKSLANADASAILIAVDGEERFDLTGNLIPSANVTYNLGSDTARWNELFLAGDTITLGDIVIKAGESNTIAFFGSDGTTPATLDSNNVDTTTISDGNSSVSIAATDGNVEVDVAGSSVATVTATGLVVTGSIEATNGFVGLDATTIEDGNSSVSVTSAGGDITANVAGSTVATFNTSGISAELTGNVTGQVSDISNHSTTDLSEGTNLYYTDTRARNALSASGDLSYNATTGEFSVTTYKDSDVESYLSGGSGINFSNGTISHTDTSSQGSVNNGGLTVIQDVTLDTFGHITGLGSKTISRTDLGIDTNDNVTFGTITVPSINKSGTDGVGNIGSSTNSFDTVHAKATSAQYADLAEMYVSDATYEPGTVVAFGGTDEVTISDTDGDARIAGVISTNPSYLMNSTAEGEHVAAVALTGRVPTRVTGNVRKGDMMVSNGDGTARAESAPSIGSVIGKSLENFDGDEGIIEVVVGRI